MSKSVTFRVVKDVYKRMPFEATVQLALKMLLAAISFLSIRYMAILFDVAESSIGNPGGRRTLCLHSAIVIAIICIPFLIEIIEPLVEEKIGEKNTSFFKSLLEHAFSLKMAEYENAEFLNQLKRAQTCVKSKNIIKYYQITIEYIPKIFQLVGVTIVAASFTTVFIPIALISVLPSVISKIVLNKTYDKIRKNQTSEERKRDYYWSLLTKSESVKELRLFEADYFVCEKWNASLIKCMEEKFATDMKAANVSILCEMGKILGLVVSIAISVVLTKSGEMSLGQLSACIAAFASLQNSSGRLAEMASEQVLAAKKAEDYYAFLDNYLVENACDDHFCEETNLIQLNNVDYQYVNSEKKALNNVSLSIKKGEHVALIGINGSGKTTLSKILTRVFEPLSGTYHCAVSRNKIAVVNQSFVKYLLNLRENIGLGDVQRINQDYDILNCIKKVGNESALKVARTIDGQIGRDFGGCEFSGGEWQKTAIARGIFKNSDILIFDEPTSALDPIVESEIMRRFLDLTQNKTVIIVSHRIGVCKLCDKVIVLREGRVVEEGDHDRLMDIKGEYALLWNEQAKWYQEEN